MHLHILLQRLLVGPVLDEHEFAVKLEAWSSSFTDTLGALLVRKENQCGHRTYNIDIATFRIQNCKLSYRLEEAL